MRNAVARLNDLLEFDEFYLPYKGVTIPCWILSPLYLDEFYLPNKGFVALDTLMGTPVLVRANDSADVIFEKSLFCLSVCCLFCAKQTRNASASTFASLSFL